MLNLIIHPSCEIPIDLLLLVYNLFSYPTTYMLYISRCLPYSILSSFYTIIFFFSFTSFHSFHIFHLFFILLPISIYLSLHSSFFPIFSLCSYYSFSSPCYVFHIDFCHVILSARFFLCFPTLLHSRRLSQLVILYLWSPLCTICLHIASSTDIRAHARLALFYLQLTQPCICTIPHSYWGRTPASPSLPPWTRSLSFCFWQLLTPIQLWSCKLPQLLFAWGDCFHCPWNPMFFLVAPALLLDIAYTTSFW